LTALTVHYAQSLDGRLATRSGDSQWLGGPRSRELAHQLRAQHEAILVGVGTVLADNPRLTVRLVPGRSPTRIVVDSTLRLPLGAHVLTDGATRTIVATTSRAGADRVRAVESRGAEVLNVQADPAGRVDLRCLLQGQRFESVLIEGGGAIITSALRQQLVNRLVVCIAPRIIGSGIDTVGDLGVARLSQALSFSRQQFTILDDDVIFDGRF